MLAAYVLAKVSVSLAHGLSELRDQPLRGEPRWGKIALSGAVFLLAQVLDVLEANLQVRA